MSEEFEEVNLFDKDKLSTVEDELKSLEADKSTEKTFSMPEKFEGKTIEDVVEAYTNLEKDHGRQANEVGELRKLTDQILKQQVEQNDVREVEKNEIGFDDLVDDPSKAVNKVLDSNPRLRALEENIEKQIQQGSHATLLERHADADAVVASPEFQEWIKTSPARMKLFQAAHSNYDADLAGELLDMWKGGRATKEIDAIAERDKTASEGLKRVVTERGSNSVETRKVFKRSELIRLKINDPARYSSMADEIREAYADGRVK